MGQIKFNIKLNFCAKMYLEKTNANYYKVSDVSR